jgi:hypothetical protein
MRVNGISVLEFSKILGWNGMAISRKISGIDRTCLRTVFELANTLAISPTDILGDPIGAAQQRSLFELSECDAHSAKTRQAHNAINSRRAMIYDRLISCIRDLLENDDPLPPFVKVCRAHGVSTGYVRYHLPVESRRFLQRRCGEVVRLRKRRKNEAYVVARRAIADRARLGFPISLKSIEKQLRLATGLPKHLLTTALISAAKDAEIGCMKV